MRMPVDLHIVAISIMLGMLMLLLHRLLPAGIGAGVLIVVPQCVIFARLTGKRGTANRGRYLIVNEVAVAIATGGYLAICWL